MLQTEYRSFRRRALIIAFTALSIVFVLWNIPQLNTTLYPFRLFVTFVHESGHGLTAIITGGSFRNFMVDSTGSGVATTVGGNRLLILPAGYLGAAFFGAALFYLANTIRQSNYIATALGIGMITLSLLFANFVSLAFLVGAVTGLALILIGWKANGDVNLLLLNILAIITALNAVLDVFLLVGNANVRRGQVVNDAAAFSREIGFIPASIWAILWTGIALAMLVVAIYFSIIRPLSRRT